MTVATSTRTAEGGSKPKIAKPELLAPAGNLEKLKCAVLYGADAVYIGGQQYGLRANADNFSFEEMEEGVEFAHGHGAKVYVATNIIAHNEDLPGVHDYFRRLYEIGIDGVIVADPALIEACKQAAPDLEIHLSTQASTTNWRSVQFWKNEGVSRIVLAREVSVEEIREIKERVDVELEVFIHGAMCISYSGRCVLSNHFTARDSNRGGCCQSCRWKYDLYEEGGEDELRQWGDAQDANAFTMSSKDLAVIHRLPEIIDLGVESFKIEGRMKSIHYVATVVKAYRQAIDAYCEDPQHYQLREEWLEEIKKSGHRSSTSGFFFYQPGHEDQLFGEAEEAAKYDFCGVVLDYDAETETATVEQRNYFAVGQQLEIFGPDHQFRQVVEEIRDEEGNVLDAARHPLQRVKIKVSQPVRPWDLLRKVL